MIRQSGLSGFISAVLMVGLSLSPLSGQASEGLLRQERVEAGLADLLRARMLIWSGTGEAAEIDRLLDSAEQFFSSLSDSADRDYFLARTALNRGRTANTRKKRSEARGFFRESMTLAESSVLDTRNSDALRVMADAGSEWMVSKGLGAIIRTAPMVQEWVDEALVLDPGNILGVIISASGQINAPRSAGGDPEAAVLRLETLLASGIADDVARFRARQALAAAYKKTKRKDLSAEQCRLAADIFPESPLEDCP